MSTTRLRVYLAGASREADRVRSVASLLESSELVEFTSTWWEPSAYGTPEAWSGKDWKLSPGVRMKLAIKSLVEIRQAQLFLMLWPRDQLRSAAEAELGIAVTCDELRIVTSGAGADHCVFTALAARFLSLHGDQEACAYVLEVAEAVVARKGS